MILRTQLSTSGIEAKTNIDETANPVRSGVSGLDFRRPILVCSLWQPRKILGFDASVMHFVGPRMVCAKARVPFLRPSEPTL
jgi:hypothetical protein